MADDSEQPSFGRITNGIMRSAINGMVMMGIYVPMNLLLSGPVSGMLAGMGIAAGTAPLIASACIVIAAVSIFGGIVASGILKSHRNETQKATEMERELQQTELDGPTVTPTLATERAAIPPIPVIADAAPHEAAQAAEPTRNWSARPDIAARTDRIQQILADGASDRSHAEALLDAQRNAANAPTLH